MILQNLPYVPVSPSVGNTMSACLAMIFAYYDIPAAPIEVYSMFSTVFMSDEFHEKRTHALDNSLPIMGEMIGCALYLVNNMIPKLKAEIIETNLKNIRLSFIKRRIPLICTGTFPFVRGKITNSIVTAGYVDDYIIVHDPRGNANTGYKDQYGEHMVYSESMMADAFGLDYIPTLRILKR
jgi:hypothetical protein